MAAAVAAAAATRSTLLRHGLLAFRNALQGRLCSGSKAQFVMALLGGLEYAFRGGRRLLGILAVTCSAIYGLRTACFGARSS
eukprot:1293230-Alexandrium_andersonii.AAC.1